MCVERIGIQFRGTVMVWYSNANKLLSIYILKEGQALRIIICACHFHYHLESKLNLFLHMFQITFIQFFVSDPLLFFLLIGSIGTLVVHFSFSVFIQYPWMLWITRAFLNRCCGNHVCVARIAPGKLELGDHSIFGTTCLCFFEFDISALSFACAP